MTIHIYLKSTNRTFHFDQGALHPNFMGTYGILMKSTAKKYRELRASPLEHGVMDIPMGNPNISKARN